MFKNVASQKMIFIAYDSTTGVPKTGDAANITAYVSIDGGAVTILTDTSATEMSASNAPGAYIFDVSQAESNGNMLLFSAKSSTPNVYVDPALVFTTPANFTAQSIDSNGRVDVIKIAGTTQTARDIGASVLISSGTGAGQLDVTSGVVKSNLVQILGTALTETAGQIAAGFRQFFNIASPTSTMNTITAVTTVNGLATGVITASSIAASALNGKGDWNIGKTGYSLSAAGVQAIWDALTSALTTVGSVGKLLVDNINATISSRMATYAQPTGFLAATFPSTVASPTNITAGTITTATNLTNAPTNGDFTAAMKTSLNAATPSVTVSDKTGFSLSAGGIQAIWDALTSALTAVGSIGRLLVTNIDAAISSRSTFAGGAVASVTGNVGGNVTGSVGSVDGLTAANLDVAVSSRLASGSYTAPDNAGIAGIKAKTDSLAFTVAGQVDSNIQYVNDVQVTGNGQDSTPWGPV